MALTQVPNSMLAFDGGPLGMRNRIINGAMAIDQRNAGSSQTITAGTSTYCIDRWACYALGANVTTQQVASGVTGVPFVLQLTGAASNTSAQLLQRIESKNIADLAGTTVTLSALISNSLVTTVTWYAYYANAADNYTAVTLISQGNFTVTSTLASYSAQITLPASAANGVQIVFVAANQTSGTFKLGNVQLEAGSVATPFERRQYGQELALCQRYYQQINGAAGGTGFAPIATGVITTATTALMQIPFNTAMRQPPIYSYSGTITLSSGALSYTVTSITTQYTASSTSGMVTFTASAGTFTAASGAILFASNAATNYFAMSAEL